ncbi:MAG: mannose-1-phosphate guanylyltransferase [Candidatus Binatia bacterium]|nr:MAG: mannose-1-phosphate guanylyltransferase [Candidatus Binatia bacterium]
MGDPELYTIVMAGGQGTRFWPLSRRNLPKQALKIGGRRTLLEETLSRARAFCPPERTLIVTAREHAPLVRRLARGIPRSNVLVEPRGRNTAPCIALAAAWIRARGQDPVTVVLPADHRIGNPGQFLASLRRAVSLARSRDVLVTLGVRPRFPETGYGYIELGEEIRRPRGWLVRKFHEKPDPATAAKYCRSGRYLWNSGIFVWRTSVFWEELSRHAPGVAGRLERVWDSARPARRIEGAYRRLPAVSVDHAVLERTRRAAVVAADFSWSDVGSWAAMPDVWGTDRRGNASRGRVLFVDSSDNVVFAGRRLVALLGVERLVVVDAGDAILVCRREKAQEVRKVVAGLRAKGLGRFS